MWNWKNLYQNLEVLEVLLLVSKCLRCLDDVETDQNSSGEIPPDPDPC